MQLLLLVNLFGISSWQSLISLKLHWLNVFLVCHYLQDDQDVNDQLNSTAHDKRYRLHLDDIVDGLGEIAEKPCHHQDKTQPSNAFRAMVFVELW
jgi:hypothetical protein